MDEAVDSGALWGSVQNCPEQSDLLMPVNVMGIVVGMPVGT